MSSIYLFWDIVNDELEILGENGEFYFYSEDSVALEQGDEEGGRNWTKLNKMQDVTPLNNYERFEFYSQSAGGWIRWGQASPIEIVKVRLAAGDPDWAEDL